MDDLLKRARANWTDALFAECAVDDSQSSQIQDLAHASLDAEIAEDAVAAFGHSFRGYYARLAQERIDLIELLRLN